MKIFNKERTLTPSWELVRPSLDLVKKHLWQVVYLSFLPTLLITIGLVLLGASQDTVADLNVLTIRQNIGLGICIIAGLWTLLAYPGFIYLQTQAMRGKEPETLECFKKGLQHLGAIIGAFIMSLFIVFFGLIAFIIPGLIAFRGLFLVPYYIVEQDLGPIEAIKMSFASSKPVSAWIWGVIGVELVFGIIGSLFSELAVVGLLISLLVSYIYIFAPALRYGEVIKAVKSPITSGD